MTCGLRLSNSSKSSCFRLPTARPAPSRTTTRMSTRFTLTLKVASSSCELISCAEVTGEEEACGAGFAAWPLPIEVTLKQNRANVMFQRNLHVVQSRINRRIDDNVTHRPQDEECGWRASFRGCQVYPRKGGGRMESWGKSGVGCQVSGVRSWVLGLGSLILWFSVLPGSMACEEFPFVHFGWYRHVKESHHHFVVGLVAPRDGAIGVWVVGIGARVVVPGNGAQLRPSLDEPRLRQAIAELPEEVEVHAQQGLGGVIGMHKLIFEALSTQMHVREKTHQQGVVGEGAVHFHSIVIRGGRNGDWIVIVGDLQSQHASRGRAFGEYHADACLIGCRFTVCGVVHLEDKFGMCGDKFRHAIGPSIG